MFYGGMVRAKNVLNMFLCVMVAIGVIGLHWVIIGYALTFAGTSILSIGGWNFLGFDPSLVLLRAFHGTDMYRQAMTGDPGNAAVPTGVPELAFVMFQGKFAIITPALIVITPCAGHVNPDAAILIGAIGGVACYLGCQLKKVLNYDDSLDAFGVHGIGGAVGALLVGVFAFRPEAAAGGWTQLGKQAIGVFGAAAFAFVTSLLIALVIHKTIGLRVDEEKEAEGLDIALHGETGYNLSMSN